MEVDWGWVGTRVAKGLMIGADGFGAGRAVMGAEAAKKLFAKGLKLRAADGLKMLVVKKEEAAKAVKAVNGGGLRACCWKGRGKRARANNSVQAAHIANVSSFSWGSFMIKPCQRRDMVQLTQG